MPFFSRGKAAVSWATPPLLVFLLAAAWLLSGKAWDPDEARYLEIPREIAESGDWMVPRLNDVPYLEKPPLYYWVLAACFCLVGPSVLAARLVSLCSAMAIVLLTRAMGAWIGGRKVGARAALVLAACPFFFALSTVVTIDIVFTLWVTAAIASFVYGITSKQGPSDLVSPALRKPAILLGYVFLALAFLTKGPVALVIPFLIWVSWRPQRSLLPPCLLPGLLIFLTLTLPWFAIIGKEFPPFLEFFFVRGHLSRFLGQSVRQVNFHTEPFYYFLPVMVGGAYPWVFFLVCPWRSLKKDLRESCHGRLLWGWLLLGFLFFSIGAGKLATYILPLFPAIAILLALRWEEMETRFISRRWQLGSAAALFLFSLVGVSLATILILSVPEWKKYAMLDRHILTGVSVLTAFLPLVNFLLFRRGNSDGAFATLIFMVLGLSLGGASIKASIDKDRSTEELARGLKNVKRPGDAMVCVSYYWPLFSFYLEEPTFILGKRGELAFGSDELRARPDLFVDSSFLRKTIQSPEAEGPRRLFVAIKDRPRPPVRKPGQEDEEGRAPRDRWELEEALGTPLYLLQAAGDCLLLSNLKEPWLEGREARS